MNWHNLSEQEFDDKLRAYLQGKEPPFDPAAWEKMNRKLESYAPNGSGKGSTWSLISIVLLLSAFFFWNVSNYSGYSQEVGGQLSSDLVQNEYTDLADTGSGGSGSSTDRENLENISSTDDHVEDTKEPKEPTSVTGNIVGKSEAGVNTSAPSNSVATPGVQSSEKAEIVAQGGANSDAGNITPSPAPPANANLNKVARPDGEFSAKNKKTVSSPDVDGDTQANSITKSNTGSNLTDQLTDVTENNSGSSRLTVVTKLSNKDAILTWNEEMVPEAAPESVALQEPPVLPARPSRWSMGLGFAPDVSLVGFAELTSPGSNFIFSLDYQLHPRLSVQSGITYGRKIYTAEGEDYNPPNGFWPYGVAPERAEAVCNVLDIPLNLRYYLALRERHSFYASMGLSTYIMLREEYDYEYENAYPNVPRYWEIRNENQHLFGIYNLSIGYQRKLNPNWSLEIEPFIKAPLSGIGFGRVNLWSTGTAFTLRYHLP